MSRSNREKVTPSATPAGPGPAARTDAPVLKGQNGLTSAYLAIYEKLQLAVTRRVGDAHTAEDIVQDAYLRLAARARPDHEVTAPDAFVFRVAGNLALDHQRRRQRRGVNIDLDSAHHLTAEGPDAERRVMDRQALNRVLEAVNHLPPRCREVFVMRKLEGRDQAEIAHRLGISRNMVEKHLRRALESLSGVVDREP